MTLLLLVRCVECEMVNGSLVPLHLLIHWPEEGSWCGRVGGHTLTWDDRMDSGEKGNVATDVCDSGSPPPAAAGLSNDDDGNECTKSSYPTSPEHTGGGGGGGGGGGD